MRYTLACLERLSVFNGEQAFWHKTPSRTAQARGGGGLLGVFLTRGKWPDDAIPTPFPPPLQIDTSRKSVQETHAPLQGPGHQAANGSSGRNLSVDMP